MACIIKEFTQVEWGNSQEFTHALVAVVSAGRVGEEGCEGIEVRTDLGTRSTKVVKTNSTKNQCKVKSIEKEPKFQKVIKKRRNFEKSKTFIHFAK